MKLTRANIKAGIEQIPMNTILGVSNKALTAKQKAFCKEVAMGQTGSEAYRRAYSSKAKPTTAANKASKLKAQDNIQTTIQAYEAAIQAQAYQTPAGLRALVIQTLVEAMTDKNEKASVKIAAAKTLGTVTEVAAFTERKEVRTITSSEDTKAKLLAKLRDMMKANAEDAEIIDTDSLMVELQNSAADATHPSPIAPLAQEESLSQLHSTPPKVSVKKSDSACASDKNPPDDDPTPSTQEDPPSGVEK
jgi:hypothetical protein